MMPSVHETPDSQQDDSDSHDADPSGSATRTANPPVNLKQRVRLPEIMDDPNLDKSLHHHALAGLRRVNVLSRSAAILWPTLRKLAAEQSGQTLRVLDIASGGGDVVTSLAKRAKAEQLDIQIDGCDISQRAVDYAAGFAAERGVSESNFFVADALNESLPGDYDVIMCSLFLHHLEAADARSLLINMAGACQKAVIVNDLRRTRFGYALAVIGCRLLTRSPVVHTDGPLSVRAAWSDQEVDALIRESNLTGATVSRHWPQRFLLSWRKP